MNDLMQMNLLKCIKIINEVYNKFSLCSYKIMQCWWVWFWKCLGYSFDWWYKIDQKYVTKGWLRNKKLRLRVLYRGWSFLSSIWYSERHALRKEKIGLTPKKGPTISKYNSIITLSIPCILYLKNKMLSSIIIW